MKIIKSFLLFQAVLLISAPAYTKSSIEDKAQKVGAKIEDKLKNIDIKAKLNLFDFDVFNFLNGSLRYGYAVQPSYIDDYFSRFDTLTLNVNLIPGDLLAGGPFGLSLKSGTEINYVRQFKSRKEAMIEPPKVFLLNKLPRNSETAIENLEVGDFVGFKSDLAIVISAGIAAAQGWVKLGASTHFILSGEFQIRVFKITPTKIRLQLVAVRNRSKGAGAYVDLSDMNIIGIHVVDRIIEKTIGIKPIDLGISKSQPNLLMVDYVLDLANEDVAQGYDEILSSATKQSALISLQAMDPRKSRTELTKYLGESIEAFERIYKEEVKKKVAIRNRRVQRAFKGSSESSAISNKVKIGINLLRFENEEMYSENHLSYVDEDEKAHYFYFPSYTERDAEKILFGLFEEDERVVMNALFEETSDQEVTKFLNFGIYYTRTDKNFNRSEQKRLKHELKQQIPQHLYDQIVWGDFEKPVDRINARVTNEFYFHREAYEFLSENFNTDLYEDAWVEYLGMLMRKDAEPSAGQEAPRKFWQHCENLYLQSDQFPKGRVVAEKSFKHLIGFYASDICYLSKKLTLIFSSGSQLSPNERVKMFTELRKNSLFAEVGLGYLYYIMPIERVAHWTSAKVKWSAKDAQATNYEFGSVEKRSLYDSILSIQSILTNQAVDLRLIESIVDKDSEGLLR